MPPYVGLRPTVPVTAPGWRIEPPVSVPIASGASKAATAAAEPPPEPPGMRSRSQGLWVGPYAECSVEEPIANSSMLVLPRIGRPAARSRVATVASYGGTQPSRIFEPTVVVRPLVAITSFTAIGTPSSGEATSPAARRASDARAAASAPSLSTWRNACTAPSTAAIRSRCAMVRSTDVVSPASSIPASTEASMRVRSVMGGLRGGVSVASSFVGRSLFVSEDPGDREALLLHPGRAAERLLRREARGHRVVAEHVAQRQRVGRRRHVLDAGLADGRDRLQDHRELRCEVVELGVVEVDPGEVGQVGHLGTTDLWHAETPARTGCLILGALARPA